MRFLLAPLTLALAFAQPQKPAVQDPPAPPVGGFESAQLRGDRVRESLLGAWQLTRGEIPALGVAGGGVAGYAIFIEGYMSMEVHAQGKTVPDSQDSFFQTGTHRWKYEDTGVLETFSLIGTHNVTDDEEYEFEQPGARRAYKVQVDGDRLVLERADRSARLNFMRLGKLRYPDDKDGPGVDFFGRPIPPAEGEGKKRK